MGTATNHSVSDRVKPYVICHFLTSGHSDAQPWASECPDVKNYKWRLNLVWHRMLCSCTHMTAVSIKGLSSQRFPQVLPSRLFCTWHSQCSTDKV